MDSPMDAKPAPETAVLEKLDGLAASIAELTGSVTGLKSEVGAFRVELNTLSKDVSDVRQHVSDVRQQVTDVRRQVVMLGDRVSDIDSGQRSRQLAGQYSGRLAASSLSPAGGAFAERESDFQPRSPLAQ